MKMNIPTWTQKSNTLFCSYNKVEVFFNFPDNINISLEKIHPDLLKVAEWLIFGPWIPSLLKDHKWTRSSSNQCGVGLSYSGGVDSTAALTILEGMNIPLELFYLQRDIQNRTSLKQENPLHSISEVEKITGKRIHIIKTNFEIVRSIFPPKRMVGFSTDLSILIGQVLTADIFNIKYLSCGMIMETAYFHNGVYHDNSFRDFNKSSYWETRSTIFKNAGFELFFPTIGCAEILATKILNAGKFNKAANSCVRSTVSGQGCMKCYKCFRKNAIEGKLIPIDSETAKYLDNPILKTGMSLIYAYNKYSLNIPQMSKYKGLLFDFLEQYYPYAIELTPTELRDAHEKELKKYASPITIDIKEINANER